MAPSWPITPSARTQRSSPPWITAVAAAGIALLLLGCQGTVRALSTPSATLARTEATPSGGAPAPSDPPSRHSLRETFETFPSRQETPARIRLLVDNTQAWVERWRLLAEAKSSLDVSYFILRDDVFGVAFLGHLLKRAKEGVRVRVVFDGFGTNMSWSALGNDYLDELANARNLTVKMFRPRLTRYVDALVALDLAAAVSSEHDKIIVADGRRSIIGGRNISVEYFADTAAKSDAFHDTDVWIDGKNAGAALTQAFEVTFDSKDATGAGGEMVNLVSRRDELLAAYTAMDRWLRAAPGSAAATRHHDESHEWDDELEKLPGLRGALLRPRQPERPAATRVLDSMPRVDAKDDPITRAFVRLVQSARRTILIQTPYLVLSEEGAEVLAAAGRRGVAITVLTNSPVSSDNAISQAFFLEQWPELLARVPNMRLFVGGAKRTLHDKVAVFDDMLATIGTYNIDPTSMALNGEVVAAVWSPALARAVAAEPRRLIRVGPPSVYEYRIARDAKGNPIRDDSGEPGVAFGPRDHCTPEQWAALGAYWTMLKTAKFVGFSALF